MKINDVVKVCDGSYSMALVKGTMKHVNGSSFRKCQFRVHGLSGMYPTDRPSGYNSRDNDTLLVDVNDSDFVLFTQERFCSVVTPVVDILPPTEVEIVVPRRAKVVHLILPS